MTHGRRRCFVRGFRRGLETRAYRVDIRHQHPYGAVRTPAATTRTARITSIPDTSDPLGYTPPPRYRYGCYSCGGFESSGSNVRGTNCDDCCTGRAAAYPVPTHSPYVGDLHQLWRNRFPMMPSIDELERRWGSRWRLRSERQLFSNRKVVMDEVVRLAAAKG